MTTRIAIHLRHPGLAERLWCRRLGTPLPLHTGSTGPWHEDWVRLLPQHWRRLHRAYAATFGFFWLPCMLCDVPYGGHQWAGSIPDPTKGPGHNIGICPRCTQGRRAP
ncbi:hypothetical protein [Streptomyces phytophilus]|uniref:hypothetical protein n=1 Tax=Streptomyces phytophilus TaxID=722715 RepID=UPI0015F0E0BE|nr:hypothetical protein [Streptomyces phytophilus]